MDKDKDAYMMMQLQQSILDERRARREYEMLLAAEARHRLRILNDNRTRLEDLAGEWIEMLRDNMGKTNG